MQIIKWGTFVVSDLYMPKLKYIFCLTRKRSLWPTMSIMRYMNSIGIAPQLIINGVDFGKDQHLLITKELNLYKIEYKEITSLPDYDVMFSESGGLWPFEKRWLCEGKDRGKINILLMNSACIRKLDDPSPYLQTFVDDKLVDGICAKIEKPVLFQKKLVDPLFMINVGDPDWDWWQTEEFRGRVRKTKLALGDKTLVLCGTYTSPKQATAYTELCIRQARNLGFRLVINPHPDRWNLIPKQFHEYCNWDIHHHVLFQAASHVISSIGCTVISEGLFLGTKVGCEPSVSHCDKWGEHKWLDRDAWATKISKQVDSQILDMVSPVFDEKDLRNFLSSSVPGASVESAGKAFGRIVVPNYTAYLFKTLDEKLGK